MPLETSAALMLDLLPPKLAEACTPPFFELQIEGLPKAEISQNGLLTCGSRRMDVPVSSQGWRAAARRIVRLADAAACDFSLWQNARRHMEVVQLPNGNDAKTSDVVTMPPWAWKIDRFLLKALQDLGVEQAEIFAGANSSIITIRHGSGTPGLLKDVTAKLVGYFPIITVDIELKTGLRIKSKTSTHLICNQRFPLTVSGSWRGEPLGVIVKIGNDAIESIPIMKVSQFSEHARVKLQSDWVQLAPVPDEIILSLPSDMQTWFYPPRWGRNPALLDNALRLLTGR